MKPWIKTALVVLAPKFAVLASIIWKVIEDPTAALASTRVILENGAAVVEKFSEVVIGTKELMGQGSPDQAKLDKAIRKSLTKELDELTQNQSIPAGDIEPIVSAVEEALNYLLTRPINQASWLKAHLSPEQLAENLVQDCPASLRENIFAQQVMQTVCKTAFEELAKNQPAINMVFMGAFGEVLKGQGQGAQTLGQMSKDIALLRAGQETLIAKATQENGVSPRVFDPLRKLLAEEGEDLSEEMVVAKIQQTIEGHQTQLKNLEDQIKRLSEGSFGLKLQARDLLITARPFVNEGDAACYLPIYEKVKALLTKAKQADALETASINEQMALGYKSQFDYLKAAALFHEAADDVRFDTKARFKYLDDAFDALFDHGGKQGNNDSLVRAITLARQILEEYSSDRTPQEHFFVQGNLGNALAILGERESGTARLEEAVEAYREAMKACPREHVPLNWALMKNNLGNALQSLGERESGTARLEEAVEAYREALTEWTRERGPLRWATALHNLGSALSSLGVRESGTLRLEQAMEAYREALMERTRELVPLDWAMSQNNLGNALQSLGERESGTARLEQAVEAHREALKERTRERVPLQWAETQNNLGNALRSLGERESGTARLEEAEEAYRMALEERTRKRVPLHWATTQANLGNALSILGKREPSSARLGDAVAAYCEALKEQSRDRVPLEWAMTQNNLGNALASLGGRESGTVRLNEAVVVYRLALEVFDASGASHYFDIAKRNLQLTETLIASRRAAESPDRRAGRKRRSRPQRLANGHNPARKIPSRLVTVKPSCCSNSPLAPIPNAKPIIAKLASRNTIQP